MTKESKNRHEKPCKCGMKHIHLESTMFYDFSCVRILFSCGKCGKRFAGDYKLTAVFKQVVHE